MIRSQRNPICSGWQHRITCSLIPKYNVKLREILNAENYQAFTQEEKLTVKIQISLWDSQFIMKIHNNKNKNQLHPIRTGAPGSYCKRMKETLSHARHNNVMLYILFFLCFSWYGTAAAYVISCTSKTNAVLCIKPGASDWIYWICIVAYIGIM